jgi:hypothetical protein
LHPNRGARKTSCNKVGGYMKGEKKKGKTVAAKNPLKDLKRNPLKSLKNPLARGMSGLSGHLCAGSLVTGPGWADGNEGPVSQIIIDC